MAYVDTINETIYG